MARTNVVSPSRNYVAICNKTNFDGHYMKHFKLPEFMEETRITLDLRSTVVKIPVPNNSEFASWYFLNRLNSFACLEMIVTAECIANMSEQSNPYDCSKEN